MTLNMITFKNFLLVSQKVALNKLEGHTKIQSRKAHVPMASRAVLGTQPAVWLVTGHVNRPNICTWPIL